MADLKQLSKEGLLFIAGENKSVYQHTAGLVMLDTSNKPDFNFDTFREQVIERVGPVPYFHWRLEEVPFGLDLPYWVEDEDFSYDHHIKRIALPSPGDKQALSEVACHLYSKHLDRSRPLWEIWFIEGLEGNKCAILQKIHHCMMDGEGASKLGELMCDFEPDPPPYKIDAAIASARAGRKPGSWELPALTGMRLAQLPTEMSRNLYQLALPKVREAFNWKKKPKAEKPPMARAYFNTRISPDRAFVWCSLPLKDIKAAKNHFDVTINDMVLALVGGAIRSYLLDQGKLPKEALQAMMAVSLRSEGDEEFSNKVTTIPVSLATNITDPKARLRKINQLAGEAKKDAKGGRVGVMELFQLLPPVAVKTLMESLAPEQVSQIMGANLIVSNIRGSAQPMYVAGVKMETMFPISILSDGISINFTCLSYTDHLDIGVVMAPELFPEPWTIIDALEQTLAEYAALAKPKAARKKSTPRKKPKARKKKAAAAR